MTTLTSTKKLGDLLKHEYDYRYTRRKGSYTNGTGSEVKLPVGQPFSIVEATGVLTAIAATGEAGTECLLIQPIERAIADGETVELTVLHRGPALINEDALPDNDLADVAYTKADIVTALQGLSPPVDALSEPDAADTSEQTT